MKKYTTFVENKKGEQKKISVLMETLHLSLNNFPKQATAGTQDMRRARDLEYSLCRCSKTD